MRKLRHRKAVSVKLNWVMVSANSEVSVAIKVPVLLTHSTKLGVCFSSEGGWGTRGTSISEPCAYMIALWDIAAQAHNLVVPQGPQ